MTNSDILRSIRYLLNVNDGKVVEITELGGYLADKEEIVDYLKHETEEGYRECPDRVLSYFLNGLVTFKRGEDPGRPPAPLELPVTNNTVLKKLRVAFQLKDTDVIRLIENQGLKVSKAEIGAFFRDRDHRNYRLVGDQFLRHLFKALSI